MKNLILLSVIALFSTAASAQEDKLANLDIDKDGRISVEEAAKDEALAALFADLDKDKDGYLTEQELNAE